MDITPPNRRRQPSGKPIGSNAASAITITHQGKTLTIQPNDISSACQAAAKQAYDLGETNNAELYEEDMRELIKDTLRERGQPTKRNRH
tara:strand:- start:1120 stop:1386 length:267 start_codon:yes stop_codon:yes gene_type:complete